MASLEIYECNSAGCGRRFKRQEHLTRHQKSHDPANVFICQVCQREFNRKDSLNRHLALHPDVLTISLPKKTKRACVACRKGKNKCDGEARCSTCVRREVECRYLDGDEEDVSMGGTFENATPEYAAQNNQNPGGGSSLEPLDFGRGNHEVGRDLDPFSGSSSLVHIEHNGEMRVPSDALSSGLKPQTLTIPQGFGKPKIIDWMTVKIRQDPVNTSKAVNSQNAQEPDIPDYESYIEEFFSSFHHRWLLIHQPTYKETESNKFLLASMRMIGAWLVGTVQSKAFALTTHEKCVNGILPKLHLVTCKDNFWNAPTASMCHAAVFNIIFGLYYGNEREISRSVILLNTLAGALREVGFFDEDTAWPDDKPNLFPPMRMVGRGQRQRLATSLFKIDAYLSILRNQPPSINWEELYFPLSTTYAIYNSDGLHIWEERQPYEPTYRDQTMIFQMITGRFGHFHEVETNPMLIEDIQLCLCAAWSSIWRILKKEKHLCLCNLPLSPEKAILKQQLDGLKTRLDRIQNQLFAHQTSAPEEYLPSRYYMGHEDSSLPSSAGLVTTRMKHLLLDATMLYHLLSIHISAHVATLVRINKDKNPTAIEEISEIQTQARIQRLRYTERWATSANARSALCDSVEILLIGQSADRNRDPISNIALTIAAIVVHTYCALGSCACQICVPNPAIPVVELTILGREERDAWIGGDGELRPQVQGMQLCRCNAWYFMGLFKGLLPVGWEVAHIVPDSQQAIS